MDRILPYLAMAFCVIAVLVDFTSKVLSVAVDGCLLTVVVVILYRMSRNANPNTTN